MVIYGMAADYCSGHMGRARSSLNFLITVKNWEFLHKKFNSSRARQNSFISFLECGFSSVLSVFVELESGFCKKILFFLVLYVFVVLESVFQKDIVLLSFICLRSLSERV